MESLRTRTKDEINDKWPRPSKGDGQVVVADSADEVKEVASKVKEVEKILCITGEEPEALIRDLVEKYNIETGKLICCHGVIDGFSINEFRLKRAFPGAFVGDQPDKRGQWCKNRFGKVVVWVEKLSNKVTPREALSHYSMSTLRLFGEYHCGPRCGLLHSVPEESKILGIDVARANTGVMASLPLLLV